MLYAVPISEKYELIPELKEFYSDEIRDRILSEVAARRCEARERGLTLLFVAPPGTGKSHALADLTVDTLSGGGLCRELGYITHLSVYQPTHSAFEAFSRKVIATYQEAFASGKFGRVLPVICVVRGSIYSCMRDDALRHLEEIRRILSECRLDIEQAYTLQRMLSTQWETLPKSRRLEIVRMLVEVSTIGEVEMTMSMFCSICPHNRESLKLTFLETLFTSRIDIVDTDRRRAREIVDDLVSRGSLPREASEVCPYRALLGLEFTNLENDLIARVQSRGHYFRPYVLLLTHALLSNVGLCDLLRKRYSVVLASGRRSRRAIFIDEVDMLLHAAPVAKLPLQFCSEVQGSVNVSRIRSAVRRYTLSTNLRYLTELVNMVDEYWRRMLGARGSSSQLARIITELLDRLAEYPEDNLTKIRNLMKTWRDKIRERIADRGEVDVEDLAIYYLCSRLLNFVEYVRESELNRLAEHGTRKVKRRFNLAICHRDPRNWIDLEIDIRNQMVKVTLAGLETPMLEHAIRLVLDHDYPLPFKIKLGVTATLTRKLISSYLRLASPALYTVLTDRKVSLYMIDVQYRNIYFVRGLFWIPLDIYDKLARGERLSDEDRERLERLELKSMLPKKTLLLEESEALRQYAWRPNVRIRRGVEALLMIIHEVVTTYLKYIDKHQIGAVVFTGTKPQAAVLIDSADMLARLVNRAGEVRVGNYVVTSVDILSSLSEIVELCAVRLEARLVNVHDPGDVRVVTLLITHSKSRLARAVDLDEYDTVVILAPPLETPRDIDSVLGLGYTKKLMYMRAAVAVEQAIFRIIRRAFYPTPKVIIVDAGLTDEKYLEHMSRILRRRLRTAVPSPTLKRYLVESVR